MQKVERLFENGKCSGLWFCYYAEHDGYWYALFEIRHDALLAYQYITVNRVTLRGAVIMVSPSHAVSVTLVFMPPVATPDCQTRRRHCFRLVRLSTVRPSVRLLTKSERDVLKTSEPNLMPIGTSGPRSKRMKRSTFGIRRSKVKVKVTRGS